MFAQDACRFRQLRGLSAETTQGAGPGMQQAVRGDKASFFHEGSETTDPRRGRWRSYSYPGGAPEPGNEYG